MISPEIAQKALANGEVLPLPPSVYEPNPHVVRENGVEMWFTSKWMARRYRKHHGIPQFPYDQLPDYEQAIDDYSTFLKKYGGCSSVG